MVSLRREWEKLVRPEQPPAPLSDQAKLRGLPWLLAHHVFNAVFAYLTVFGPVFLLFLADLGLPKSQIGLLLSLLPFCGLLALGFAPVATRQGRRRVFLIYWTARKVVIAGLLLLPWVMSRFGHGGALIYMMALIAAFAVCRALAETAWYPWVQEVIPDHLRGRFGANNTLLSTVATCGALILAGQVIKHGPGLERYMLLIVVGVVFGLAGTAVMIPVQGGRPQAQTGPHANHLANMLVSLRDRNFRFYLLGLGGVTAGTLLYLSFLPLFLKERLGVAPGVVVTLETVVMIGGALSALLWGRAADRVGSRPVLMSAVAVAFVVPVGWLLLPREVASPLLWCGLLYFIHGIALNGCAIGTGRWLLNGVVPPAQNTAYMALYYAWLGLVGGSAPLVAGALLQAYGSWHRPYLAFTADGHAVLFGLGALMVGLGWACYARVRPDDRYRTRDLIHAAAERVLQRLSW